MGYQHIDQNECLSDSLLKINANAYDFDSRIEALKGADLTLLTTINVLSSQVSFNGGVVVFNEEQTTSGTPGGSFTANVWSVRTLNNEKYDTYNLGTLNTGTSQFSLNSGVWQIRAEAPAYGVGKHQCRIFNATDGVVVSNGDSSYSSTSNSSISVAVGTVSITPGLTKTFQIEHRCEVTRLTNGFGIACSFGNNEVYTIVTCTKIR